MVVLLHDANINGILSKQKQAVFCLFTKGNACLKPHCYQKTRIYLDCSVIDWFHIKLRFFQTGMARAALFPHHLTFAARVGTALQAVGVNHDALYAGVQIAHFGFIADARQTTGKSSSRSVLFQLISAEAVD